MNDPQEPQNSSFQFFLLLSCCLFMEFVPSTWPSWLWHGKLSLKRGRSEKALKNLRCKTLLCACSRPKSGMESLWVKWAFSNIKFVMLEEQWSYLRSCGLRVKDPLQKTRKLSVLVGLRIGVNCSRIETSIARPRKRAIDESKKKLCRSIFVFRW